MFLSEVGPLGSPNDHTEIGQDQDGYPRMPYRFHVFGAALYRVSGSASAIDLLIPDIL